ncbi:MAG: STAS/SEC14 domain-containing protein [Bacteroidetes bacterium]|nr:STAS/SEC14 domain-containing protein [Bacteroidota bacterium]
MGTKKETQIIKTQNISTYLRENGIIHCTYKKGSKEDLETSKENVEAIRKVAGYQKRPLLVDIRGNVSQTKESRDYFSSDEVANYFSTVALIIDGSISKVIGNFYMDINKPKTPTRLFTSEKEAMKWLKSFV